MFTSLRQRITNGLATAAVITPNIGGDVGLGTADLRRVVVNVIQLVLGFLPLVAVVMLILGGLMWMTAAGNEEKIDRAKKTISAAVVGMIIVLLAWAIVTFFAGTTRNVTQ